MNFNNFTIKSQEAVQQAVNVTQARGQQAIEPVHLLAGVCLLYTSLARAEYHVSLSFIFSKRQALARVIVILTVRLLIRFVRCISVLCLSLIHI